MASGTQVICHICLMIAVCAAPVTDPRRGAADKIRALENITKHECRKEYFCTASSPDLTSLYLSLKTVYSKVLSFASAAYWPKFVCIL
ncbi:hypothetical protein L596_010449 [Steinernema carpocapsae]|uniref:Secreted protein n=1 Tax=Steinernema carpocapsae TaxID=34508 RepID=A0A4U5PJQ7_STECR|nr:hypothetical protein L596_010449 [Steinernema carpocapsae]